MNNKETPPVQPVRTCASCACVTTVVDPNDINNTAYFCRREPPEFIDERVRIANPLAGQKGQPQLLEGTKRTFLPGRPTVATGVCFDGWRPEATEPGDNWTLKQYVRELEPALQQAFALIGLPPKPPMNG